MVREREVKIGEFKGEDRQAVDGEVAALRFMLNQLDVPGLELNVKIVPRIGGKKSVIAHISWPDDVKRESLQHARRIDEVIAKVGKK